MIQFSLSTAGAGMNAQHIGADALFSAVSTDTRTLAEGELFVALAGPHFDGHDYLQLAHERGAAGAMVDRDVVTELPLLQVDDTLKGLGALSSLWRQACSAPVVAVTGSNGKTTVKEMIAAILSRRGEVLATQGNLNNHIGMPLTLLRLQEQAYAVVEMGANNPGEIACLSSIAQPDVAVLTNAGRAHLEGFGTLEGVARAKGKIIAGLAADGCFVFNADDKWAGLWLELAGDRQICSFGVEHAADISSRKEAYQIDWNDHGFIARFPVTTPAGELEIELALAGQHNRMNALAAIGAAQAVGAEGDEIIQGLASLKPIKGRLQPLAGVNGVGLIDDSYNANPDSVGAAIAVLSSAPGRRFLILGEMAEMGSGEAAFYQELGLLALESGIDHLYAVGAAGAAANAFGAGGVSFESREALVDSLLKTLQQGDKVLVKGSRSAAMELVINRLITGETH